MVTTVYEVVGMTCEHCVRTVSEEVSKLEGVEAVAVDLGSSRVTVTSAIALPRGDVAAAVDQAGYELVA